MKQHYLLIIIILLLTKPLAAQQYPIHIHTHIVHPVSPRLSEFESFPGRIHVTTQLQDLSTDQYTFQLKVIIKGPGYTIRTREGMSPVQLSLLAGESLMLEGSQLAPLFYLENLQFEGYSKDSYYRNGGLPEGPCQFIFRAYDIPKNIKVSNDGMSMHSLSFE